MAAPTTPTPTRIINAAYRKYAKRVATSAEITNATEEIFEEIKNDIVGKGTQYDFLRTITYQPVTAYVSGYQCPTDYKKILSARLMAGTRTDTAQAAASTTLTLASTDSGVSSDTQGKMIVILSATAGSGQANQVTSYNSSTKVATFNTAWSTTPTGTIVYLVVDTFTPLSLHTNYDRDALKVPNILGAPGSVFHLGDSAEGDLQLDTVPDRAYAIELVYFVDLRRLDLASTRYSHVLELLYGLFVQGTFTYLLHNDNRYAIQRQIYDRKLLEMAALHLYPNDDSEMGLRLDF